MTAKKHPALPDDKKAYLLERVTAATLKAAQDVAAAEKAYKQAVAAARAPRARSIIHALNVGVPRAEVAAAAGISYPRMYKLMREQAMPPVE